MEENRIPPKILYMNLETMMLRGSPRNRWQQTQNYYKETDT
jgi:hypothetical protein